MHLRAQFWHLFSLLLLVLHGSFCDPCPQQCSCNVKGSIFCIQRRSSSMPLNLPPNTHSLYVFRNEITSLQQKDFLGLADLVTLDISHNVLTRIPDRIFSSLSSLNNLDLSSNRITHISKDSFAGLVKLERLYLHSNHIQFIHPAAFSGLENLLELKLQGNNFSVLPILHMPKLLLLDLSHTRIPEPEPDNLQTPQLESLLLAGLGLTTLNARLMKSLGNLQELDVSQNKLVGMPPALRSAKGLIRLNLAGNPLGPLRQDDFKNLVGLQVLDLSDQKLQGFPVGFFQMFPRLQLLTVAKNPFNCVCALAWFPNLLKDKNIALGRKEETRCHFPPINARRMLAELEHKDFGCPTTITEQSDILTSSSMNNTPDPTTAPKTTHVAPIFIPSEKPTVYTNQYVLQEEPLSPSDTEEYMCPTNICLNGGTCRFVQRGQVDCLCPPNTSGAYCENQDESEPPPVAPRISVVSTVQPDNISYHHVTSTSISLDLHRYIESRPNVRGIRLTYRNLSGPDRRPLQLNVPATYPEYTLRGLQPNCTYSVCASPLSEPIDEATRSCMEARTAGISPSSPSVDKQEPFTTLVPILAAVAVVMAVAIVAAVVVAFRRRRTKTPKDLDLVEPSLFELEGVKTCLENGTASQKPPEITTRPQPSQNGVDYEVPLIQEQFVANNNTDERLPSYF